MTKPLFNREILPQLKRALERGKSVLLLGARQTGKTTLLTQHIKPDLLISFARKSTRQQYERNLELLEQEIKGYRKLNPQKGNLLVAIDEVQKVPAILDEIQALIDEKKAQFILTGSSARKLKRDSDINLLPGRIVSLKLDPLIAEEMVDVEPTIEELILYGSLPEIITTKATYDKEIDLQTYVETYLEEEIRAEALVRNIMLFSRFLELAAFESGNIINFSKLSQEIGVSHNTIISYYQILDDCLIAHRIDPITYTKTRRKLSKSPKYLLFDLGVRRLCAKEGTALPTPYLGKLFEQFVGLELLRHSHLTVPRFSVKHWRCHSGPEVDYVIENQGIYTPIEVKWTTIPTIKDCKHLDLFLNEHPNSKIGYIVCRNTKKLLLKDNILAIPWNELALLLKQI